LKLLFSLVAGAVVGSHVLSALRTPEAAQAAAPVDWAQAIATSSTPVATPAVEPIECQGQCDLVHQSKLVSTDLLYRGDVCTSGDCATCPSCPAVIAGDAPSCPCGDACACTDCTVDCPCQAPPAAASCATCSSSQPTVKARGPVRRAVGFFRTHRPARRAAGALLRGARYGVAAPVRFFRNGGLFRRGCCGRR
jgi:hypothetical protein